MDRNSHNADGSSMPGGEDEVEGNMFDREAQSVHLEDLEGSILDLQVEESESLDLAKRTIMGKVLAAKAMNKGAVKNALTKLWGNPLNLHMTDMGTNTFMFTFQDEK